LWSQPPAVLIPGTVIDWPLAAKVTQNVPGGFFYLRFGAGFYAYAPIAELYPAWAVWATYPGQIELKYDMAVNTVVVSNNAQLANPAKVPGSGAGNAAGLMSWLTHAWSQNLYFWSYVYQWKPGTPGACGGTCSLAVPGQTASAGGATGSVAVTANSTWDVIAVDPWITVTSAGSGTGNGTVTITVAANAGAARSGSILIGGQTYTVHQNGVAVGTTAGCSYLIQSSTTQSVTMAAGTGMIQIVTGQNCAWTAASNASWLTIKSGGSGTGNGAVSYAVEANATGVARSASIMIAGQMVAVNQAGSAVAPPPAALTAPVLLGPVNGATSVSAVPTFTWSAVAGATNYWLTVARSASALPTDPNAPKCGSCQLDIKTSALGYTPPWAQADGATYYWQVQAYDADANPVRHSPYSGQWSFTTNAGPACTFSISPATASLPAAAGSGSVAVAVTAGSGCTWTASSNAAWLTIPSGASGSGNGTVNYAVTANSSSSPRTGTLTIAGKTFTVTQAGAASSGVTLVRAVTLAAVPASCSNLGPTVTSFAATDAKAVLVITVSGHKAGDVASVDYVTPSGQVYAAASGPWDPVSADDASYANYCLLDQFKIAGAAPAAMPGAWTAKFYWNGAALTTLTFTITPTALPAPSLVSPTKGATGTATSAAFSWSSVSGATKYWLTVAKSAAALPTDPAATACSACAISQKVASTSYTATTPLDANATYYWEVQPYDDGVTPVRQGPYSAQWSFTTQASTSSNLVQNGSFELPGATRPGVTVPPGNPYITGWTVTRSRVAYVSNYFTCSDGNACIDLAGATDTGGGIAQTVTTVPGTAYNLTFDLAGNPDSGAPVKPLRVVIGGQATDFTFDTTGKSLTSMGWVTKTLPFTAAGTATAIEFYSPNPGYWGPVIDNVKVVAGGGTTPTCTFGVNPLTASIPAAGGSGAVTVSTATGCAWTAQSSADWLHITSGSSGTGTGPVAYSADANSSAARSATISISGPAQPLLFTANQAAAAPPLPPPTLASSGVTNLVDGSGAFAPGTLVNLTGTNFAASTQTVSTSPLPGDLGGASVEVMSDGHSYAGRLMMVSSTQANLQLPYEISVPAAQLRVKTSDGVTDWTAMVVTMTAPRIMLRSGSGPAMPMVLHLDGSLAGKDSPLQAGETVQVLVTGLGATTPPATSGAGAPEGTKLAVSGVTVRLGGTDADVQAALLSPQPGVYVVTFLVPSWLKTGDFALTVSANGQDSQLVAALPVVATGMAPAQSLAVNNPSFETMPDAGLPKDCSADGGPACRTSGDNNIPAWNVSGTAGLLQPGPNYFNLPLPDGGKTSAYASGGTISQVLTTKLRSGLVYTLRVDVGRRWDNVYPNPPPAAQLFAGETPVATADSSQGPPDAGSFQTWTAVYRSLSPDPLEGQSLKIVLAAGGPQGIFDNVRLEVRPYVAATNKPEDAVRGALEAQMRGDIDSMTSFCAMDYFGEQPARDVRALLDLAKQNLAVSGFQFNPLVTSYTDDGEFAFVRAEVSYTMTQGGSRMPIHQGLFVSLVKRDSQWKVLQFNPDELLNLEYYMSDTPASTALVKDARATAQVPPAGLSDLKALNKKLNDMFSQVHLSSSSAIESGVTWGGSQVIGRVPVIGKKAQVALDAVLAVRALYQGAQDVWDSGAWTGFATVKVQEAALGGICVAWHATIGEDANLYAALGAAVSQEAESVKVHEAILKLLAATYSLSGGSPAQTSPRLFLLDPSEYTYAPGFSAVVDPTVTDYAYGKPLMAINLTASTVLDKLFPFRVVGELTVPTGLSDEKFAGLIGAVQRGDKYYIPVDLTHLVDSESSSGDGVFTGFKFGMASMVPLNLADWTATCRRGKQQLSVHLKNGESTAPITVVNSYMNFVTGFDIRPDPGASIELKVKESRNGLRVFGSNPGLDKTLWPDLTNRRECLDMKVSDPAIASLSRSSTVSIGGVSEGATTWDLLLGGSNDSLNPVPDVNASIDVKVGPATVGPIGSKWLYWRVDGSYHSLGTDSTTFSGTIGGDLLAGHILEWSGTNFTSSYTVSGSDENGTYHLPWSTKVSVSGSVTVTNTGDYLLDQMTFHEELATTPLESGETSDHLVVTDVVLQNLPLVHYTEPSTEWCVFGASGSDVAKKVRVKQTISDTKAGQTKSTDTVIYSIDLATVQFHIQ
jgi:uncharacterized protein (TIGR03437 family)